MELENPHLRIACCLIDVYLPNSHSLKEKRRVIKSLKDSLKNRFNISVAEMDHQNLWQRATLGIALIVQDSRFADKILTSIVKIVEDDLRVELLDCKIDYR